jgi:signal transduction histidine kinase
MFLAEHPYFKSVNLNSSSTIFSKVKRCAVTPAEFAFISPSPPTCRDQANEKLLKQALANLLRNAVDAMPEGGVERQPARERSVSFELADTGRFLRRMFSSPLTSAGPGSPDWQ